MAGITHRLGVKRKSVENDRAELHRWRITWQSYRRWLAEFPELALMLDNLKAEVDEQALTPDFLPAVKGPWTVDALRTALRHRARHVPR